MVTKWQQGFTAGIRFYVCVLDLQSGMVDNGVVVNTSDFHSSDSKIVSQEGRIYCWYSESSVKDQWGERQNTSFCNFCSLESSNFHRLVVVAWGKKSYLGPAKIPSFVYLLQFRDGGRRVSLRLHLFVFLMWIQRKKILCARGWVQKFSCAVSGMERFSLDLPRAVEKECTLEVGCGGVWNLWL